MILRRFCRFLILSLITAVAAAQAADPAPAPAASEGATLIRHNAEPGARLLVEANVLPLALSDEFEFRKQKITVYDRTQATDRGRNAMVRFEHDHLSYGAVTSEERNARQGQYYTFWWRSQRPAEVTVRFEYRQANLGNLVQAREYDVAVPKGTHKTKFEVIGDDYTYDGAITAWRALVIENRKIVAVKQSYLWH